MSISIKGQAAVDKAIQAMKDRTEFELFGNRYIVYDVQVSYKSVTDSINGTVTLNCLTMHRELSSIPQSSRAERDAAIAKAMEQGRKAADENFPGYQAMMDQDKNPKVSSPSMLALIDQINASDKDEREHLWLAMDAIYAEMKGFGVHGVVALALVNAGMMYTVKRGE